MTELPKGWAKGPFSDFIQPRGEKAAPADFPSLPFIGMDHVEAQTMRIIGSVPAGEMKSSAARFFEGDVLYGRLRPYLNKVAQPKFDGLASAEFIVFSGNELIDAAFLRFRLNARDFVNFATHLNEGDRPRVSFDQFGGFTLLVPPLNEQRRIVAKIEAMFERIEAGDAALRGARATLGLYRQSLLKSAFEGRLTADWRAQNADKLEPPKTLLARIQKEREARYKAALDDWQTALAEWRTGGEVGRKPGKPGRPDWPTNFNFDDLKPVPAGWLYLPFEALAWSIRNGISAKPDGQGPLKIFRISAVRARAFDLQDFRRITDTDGSMATYRLSHGDLVFTRYNGSRDYVGVSAMYRGDGSHVYPDKLIRCEFKSDILNPAYLELATNCGESRAHLESLIRTTAGQSGVSGSDVKSMPVPICSPAEQAEITRILDARLSAADKMEAEIDAALARARALRQSILKQAFAGTLVPQDPSDEPATTLLARIKAERAKTGRAKATRKVRA